MPEIIESVVSHVVSLNLRRRHLAESQRATVAAKLANLKLGQKRSDAHKCASAVTQDEAAAMLNVSRRAVQQAAVVLAAGDADLIAQLEKGGSGILHCQMRQLAHLLIRQACRFNCFNWSSFKAQVCALIAKLRRVAQFLNRAHARFGPTKSSIGPLSRGWLN